MKEKRRKSIICEECNERIIQKRNWQKFCSQKCRFKNWAKKNPRVKLIIIALLLCSNVWAIEPIWIPENEAEISRLADAIWHAEGGYKAKPYYYGIRSVDCHGDIPTCRRYCRNTIRNNVVRYGKDRKGFDSYLEFLAARYAPVDAGNDKRGVNQYWLGNVMYFLDNPKAVPLA